jgi:hypothetical protein
LHIEATAREAAAHAAVEVEAAQVEAAAQAEDLLSSGCEIAAQVYTQVRENGAELPVKQEAGAVLGAPVTATLKVLTGAVQVAPVTVTATQEQVEAAQVGAAQVEVPDEEESGSWESYSCSESGSGESASESTDWESGWEEWDQDQLDKLLGQVKIMEREDRRSWLSDYYYRCRKQARLFEVWKDLVQGYDGSEEEAQGAEDRAARWSEEIVWGVLQVVVLCEEREQNEEAAAEAAAQEQLERATEAAAQEQRQRHRWKRQQCRKQHRSSKTTAEVTAQEQLVRWMLEVAEAAAWAQRQEHRWPAAEEQLGAAITVEQEQEQEAGAPQEGAATDILEVAAQEQLEAAAEAAAQEQLEAAAEAAAQEQLEATAEVAQGQDQNKVFDPGRWSECMEF